MRLDLRVVLFAALLSGCVPPDTGGTDSGNAFQAALTVAGEGALVGSARDVASLSEATLRLNEIEFKPCAEGGEDDETDYDGDFTTDLLTSTSLGTVDLGIGSVCEVEVEAERDDGSPSITLAGVSTGGLDFTIESTANWEFEIESDVPLSEDALNELFLIFDLDVWLDGVDPDAGVDVSGVIVIDDTYNTDLLSTFEANVATTGRLEDDEN